MRAVHTCQGHRAADSEPAAARAWAMLAVHASQKGIAAGPCGTPVASDRSRHKPRQPQSMNPAHTQIRCRSGYVALQAVCVHAVSNMAAGGAHTGPPLTGPQCTCRHSIAGIGRWIHAVGEWHWALATPLASAKVLTIVSHGRIRARLPVLMATCSWLYSICRVYHMLCTPLARRPACLRWPQASPHAREHPTPSSDRRRVASTPRPACCGGPHAMTRWLSSRLLRLA